MKYLEYLEISILLKGWKGARSFYPFPELLSLKTMLITDEIHVLVLFQLAFINEEAIGCINEESMVAINEAAIGAIVDPRNVFLFFLFHV